MILRLSSVAVPHAKSEGYRCYLLDYIIPIYESAEGLVSVALLQRDFAGYVELIVISLWQSEPAMLRFIEAQWVAKEMESDLGVIQLEQRSYTVLCSREGKLRGANFEGRHPVR